MACQASWGFRSQSGPDLGAESRATLQMLCVVTCKVYLPLQLGMMNRACPCSWGAYPIVLAATGGNIVGSIEFMCRWPLANALLHMSNHN
jgi:hypothetical protein